MSTLDPSDAATVPAAEEDEAEPAGTSSDGLPVEVRETVVSAAAHAGRLDRLLVELAPEFSRSHLQRLVEGGHVQVDGRGVTQPSRRLRVGGRVRIELVPTAEALAFRPECLPIVSVFEDPFIRVIDKPAGLVVHPAAGNWSGTLLNGLLHLDPACVGLPRAGIVHRLDKDTSGLMVVGRTLEAVTGLVRMIAARTVHREYLAVAHCTGEGVPAQVDAPIGRDPRSRLRMAVVPGGKPARTDFEPAALAPGYAAVRCRLHTGRTHQIRVHLAHSRLPLVGDLLYGGVPALGIRRQALHAHRLRFEHPITGQTLAFESDPPADFSQAWEQVVGRGPRGAI